MHLIGDHIPPDNIDTYTHGLSHFVSFVGSSKYTVQPHTPLAARIDKLIDARAPKPVVIICLVIGDNLTTYSGKISLQTPTIIGLDRTTSMEEYEARFLERVLGGDV